MTVNWMARSSPNVSYAHFRTDRISLTAAIPLFAIRTCEAVRIGGGLIAMAVESSSELPGARDLRWR